MDQYHLINLICMGLCKKGETKGTWSYQCHCCVEMENELISDEVNI